MNSNEPTSVRDRILEKIERNEVRMHSRVYFALKLAGVLVLATFALLLTVFVGNILFFTLRLNGHESLLTSGMRGILLFIHIFPWEILALDVGVVLALILLLRQFQFGYRKPVLYLFFGLIALALLAGFTLDRGTRFNDRLLQGADHGALPPPLQSVYQGARRAPPGNVYRGSVLDVHEESLLLDDPDRIEHLNVILPTEGPDADRTFMVGDTVFVVGEEREGVIHAFIVHPLQENGLPPRKP